MIHPAPHQHAHAAPPPQPPASLPGEALAAFCALEREPWFPKLIDPGFFEFARREGRVPALGDDPPAYTYRGWLLWQLWLLSFREGAVARWPYYFRTLAAGRLLDEPIPRLELSEATGPKKSPHGDVGKLVERLGRELGYGERALNATVEWLAFALAVDFEGAMPELPEAVQVTLYREFDPWPMLAEPRDTLGAMLEEFRGKGTAKRASGFFLTAPTLCEFMTEAAAADASGDLRRYAVYEPACGSSRQLLYASNYSLALAGQDIDRECVLISRINSAFWIPWAAFPFTESVLGTPPEGEALFDSPAAEPEARVSPRPAPAGPAPQASQKPPARPPAPRDDSVDDDAEDGGGGARAPKPQAPTRRRRDPDSQASLFD